MSIYKSIKLGLASLVLGSALYSGCGCDDEVNFSHMKRCVQMGLGYIEKEAEICGDGIDNNCENGERECDSDGDKYCDARLEYECKQNEEGYCANLESITHLRETCPESVAHCTDTKEYSCLPKLDCDDDATSVNPGAIEVCERNQYGPYDDNCDGQIDESWPERNSEEHKCYTNSDPNGETLAEEDRAEEKGICQSGRYNECRDGALWCSGVVSKKEEVCGDQLDNDCDGLTDEIPPNPCYYDYGTQRDRTIVRIELDHRDYVMNNVSPTSICQVGEERCTYECTPPPAVSPEAFQDCQENGIGQVGGDHICYDVILPQPREDCCTSTDDNCNGIVNEGCDLDGDGYISIEAGASCGGPLDCDDTNPDVHPGALEILCNGVNDDCDPATLDNPDADGDGFFYCVNDCDDTNPNIYQGAPEPPCTIDFNCDGRITTISDFDADNDGYASAEAEGLCGPTDCNDNDPYTNPGADEICDGCERDNDCDGEVDEGFSTTYHDYIFALDCSGSMFKPEFTGITYEEGNISINLPITEAIKRGAEYATLHNYDLPAGSSLACFPRENEEAIRFGTGYTAFKDKNNLSNPFNHSPYLARGQATIEEFQENVYMDIPYSCGHVERVLDLIILLACVTPEAIRSQDDYVRSICDGIEPESKKFLHLGELVCVDPDGDCKNLGGRNTLRWEEDENASLSQQNVWRRGTKKKIIIYTDEPPRSNFWIGYPCVEFDQYGNCILPGSELRTAFHNPNTGELNVNFVKPRKLPDNRELGYECLEYNEHEDCILFGTELIFANRDPYGGWWSTPLVEPQPINQSHVAKLIRLIGITLDYHSRIEFKNRLLDDEPHLDLNGNDSRTDSQGFQLMLEDENGNPRGRFKDLEMEYASTTINHTTGELTSSALITNLESAVEVEICDIEPEDEEN